MATENKPLMPKATAVWLVDNTSLTFEQIADFCGLHPLEVKGIADEKKVQIRPHRIIYELIDEMTAMIKGQYKAEMVENVTGQAEVRHLYKISHVGTIAGCYITNGLLKSGRESPFAPKWRRHL